MANRAGQHAAKRTKTTMKNTPGSKTVAQRATAKKAVAKTTVTKKTVAKKTVAKRTAIGKAAAQTSTASKAGTRKKNEQSTKRDPNTPTDRTSSKPDAPSPKRRAAAGARGGMPPQDRETFFARLRELNPHPQTELEYTSAFELLVAVVLSAQATDVGVNKATRRLYPVANTPQAIAALGVDGLKPYIATIGLFNTKAANVIALCERLIAEHGGEVPQDRAALEALPGVGRKTANVVLNTAFGQPTMAVDTHIFRVANRTGLAPGKTVLAVEQALLKRVPPDFLQDAHHWLILHGRYTCKARRPECWRCPVRDVCRFEDKNEDGEPR